MFSFFARSFVFTVGYFLFLSSAVAQSLKAGDLVVVGYNFRNPDEFSVLSLVDLTPGTSFYITDCGWNTTTSAFRSGEGLITYTVPSLGIKAGQQIHYPDDAGFATQGINGFFGLSVAGDQLLIFQGSFQAPQFLFGLTDNIGGWLDSSLSPSNQSSHLPPSLIEGQTALALNEFLQAQFECAFPIRDKQEFLLRVADPLQWIKSADRVELPIMGCGFDVLAEDHLEWTYKIEDDRSLLIFVSSMLKPKEELWWWYYTPESAVVLACSPLEAGVFECQLPFLDPPLLLVKPCRTESGCGTYKRIDRPRPHQTNIVWFSSGGGILTLLMPQETTTYAFSLHSLNGICVREEQETAQHIVELHGLTSGFYILTIEANEVIQRIPVCLVE
jgi:hypothetical protein